MELSKVKPRKLKRIADDLVRTGIKVYHYRVDVLTPELAKKLNDSTQALDQVRKDKSTSREDLESALGNQDEILRKTGGKFYPNRGWSENVEMLLVGAFLVIGIRTFFFQPFIIPTNSMYPTYNGMTYENYVVPDESGKDIAPSKKATISNSFGYKIFRKLVFGATNIHLIAENDGEVKLKNPIPVTGRKWFVIPAKKMEFTLDVGGQEHTFRTPMDFNGINEILMESIGYNRTVKKGEDILNFDILSGDALFVDRMSYHFRKPQIGDPFVFQTDAVHSDKYFSILSKSDPGKYYIKRCVGKGGDTLELDKTTLIRNSKPITGAAAFNKNAGRIGEYLGYVYSGYGKFLRKEGDSVEIPRHHYFAMGDNSPNSSDSRTWGFVPKNAIIGKAVVIYYPFTKHWGLSR
jgi:signal peptidase I